MKFGKTVAVFSMGMALAGLILFLAGCAVEKNPPFGDVVDLKDNSTLGTTPFKHVMETKIGEEEYVTVKVSKPGYEDKVISFFLVPKYDKEEDAMNNPQQVTVELTQTK